MAKQMLTVLPNGTAVYVWQAAPEFEGSSKQVFQMSLSTRALQDADKTQLPFGYPTTEPLSYMKGLGALWYGEASSPYSPTPNE